jgi:hypothetical protein
MNRCHFFPGRFLAPFLRFYLSLLTVGRLAAIAANADPFFMPPFNRAIKLARPCSHDAMARIAIGRIAVNSQCFRQVTVLAGLRPTDGFGYFSRRGKSNIAQSVRCAARATFNGVDSILNNILI